MLFRLLFLFAFIPQLFAGVARIVPVSSIDEINQAAVKESLVKAFMSEYEDVPLAELNPNFKSIGDVRRFYEAYFESEIERYKNGHLIWIQALIDEETVGFATFELETAEKKAAYMNLLAVHPDFQRQGIGKDLAFSILTVHPHIRAINLLIRKVNQGGHAFYEKIGFVDHKVVRDNFVDPSLLTGMRWEKKVKPPIKIKPVKKVGKQPC